MADYVLVLGNRNFRDEEQTIRATARRALLSTEPRKIVVDYLPGWSQVVLDEAKKMGIPYIGAVPFLEDEKKYQKLSISASSNIVFCDTKKRFLSDPYPYLDWMGSYINEVMLYYDTETETSMRINMLVNVLESKGKLVRNFYRRNHQ